jgi:hypothetical protein
VEVNGQLHAPAALPPGKQPLVVIGQEAGLAPEPVRTRWWREKSLAPVGTITPDHPARSPTLDHWAIPENLVRTFAFHKRHGISWLAERLLGSREVLCSMVLSTWPMKRNEKRYWNVKRRTTEQNRHWGIEHTEFYKNTRDQDQNHWYKYRYCQRKNRILDTLLVFHLLWMNYRCY